MKETTLDKALEPIRRTLVQLTVQRWRARYGAFWGGTRFTIIEIGVAEEHCQQFDSEDISFDTGID